MVSWMTCKSCCQVLQPCALFEFHERSRTRVDVKNFTDAVEARVSLSVGRLVEFSIQLVGNMAAGFFQHTYAA